MDWLKCSFVKGKYLLASNLLLKHNGYSVAAARALPGQAAEGNVWSPIRACAGVPSCTFKVTFLKPFIQVKGNWGQWLLLLWDGVGSVSLGHGCFVSASYSLSAIFINNCGIRIGGSKRLLSLHVCCWPQCPSVPDLVPGWCVEKLGTHFKLTGLSAFTEVCSTCTALKMFQVLGKKMLLLFICMQDSWSISNSNSISGADNLTLSTEPLRAKLQRNKCEKPVWQSLSSECAEGQLRNLTSWWCWRQRMAF